MKIGLAHLPAILAVDEHNLAIRGFEVKRELRERAMIRYDTSYVMSCVKVLYAHVTNSQLLQLSNMLTVHVYRMLHASQG